MWLVYLRFEGKGETKITHLLTDNQDNAKKAVENAREFGASQQTPLVDYKFFHANATIKPKATSPDPLALELRDFGKQNK